MNDNVMNGAQMITKVFNNISSQDIENSGKIFQAWKTTVEKISGNGEQLAAHSSVVDLKNGILLVESDHPGWNQMLQMHKKFILIGMNRLSGGVKIDSMAFRVRGSGASLADTEEMNRRAVERYAQKIEEEQKRLEEMGYGKEDAAATGGQGTKGGASQLPPELNAIFERMKKGAGKKEEEK
ncbi:MAG: DUF721 domain-containing protein [Treponema sp.]|nr:DUF721 domain-containing protein [Treponema sp.]